MTKINCISNPQPTLGGLITNSPPFLKGGVRGRFYLEIRT